MPWFQGDYPQATTRQLLPRHIRLDGPRLLTRRDYNGASRFSAIRPPHRHIRAALEHL